jgi:hypothetical protein
MTSRAVAVAPTAGAVLTKATRRAARLLDLSDADLAAVLGVSAASVSRLGRTREIPATGAEAQLAVLFVRMFRSLDALLGDPEHCRRWLHADNAHLGRTPAELIRTVQGLVHVTEYLDAMRGKN